MFARTKFSRQIARRCLSTLPSTARTSIALYIALGAVAGGAGTAIALTSYARPFENQDTFGKFGSQDDFTKCIEELKASLPSDGVSTDEDETTAHGYSENDYHPDMAHTVIVYPTSTEEVVTIVNISRKWKMPITPYSGATSLEGAFRGRPGGGICLDMSRMNKIIEIREADSDVTVQAGVGWVDINETLKERGTGLFFPLDPGAGATIGGMMSTSCSGTNAVRYGTAKGEWFLNATVVLPSGEVIKTRRRARKSSAGWDVTKLFIGAEGTLGIITEVTLRLTALLPTTVAVVHFPSAQNAVEAVEEVMKSQLGGRIQCIELLDSEFMRATNLYGRTARKWPEKDSLFIKIQDTGEGYKYPSKVLGDITSKHGGTGFTLAASKDEAEDLWADRKNALYSGLALVEGSRGWSTDVCVPPSELPRLVEQTKADLKKVGLTATIMGHVGDGNFHSFINIVPGTSDLETAQGVVGRMVKRAIALDGTCTGEHGVGLGKRKYLEEELGVGTVKVLKDVKRVLDKHGLFNPGKLYPDEPESQDKQS